MDMTNRQYLEYVDKKSPNSNILADVLWAFLVGGAICVIGQAVGEFFLKHGMTTEQSASATSIVMIFLGAFLTGVNLYDNIAKYAGAGTLVPITGFSNAVVAPAMEFKSEGHIMGLAAKMFIIAGPVLVFGISASIVAGIFYYFLM